MNKRMLNRRIISRLAAEDWKGMSCLEGSPLCRRIALLCAMEFEVVGLYFYPRLL